MPNIFNIRLRQSCQYVRLQIVNTKYNRHRVAQIMITKWKVTAITEELPLFSPALDYVHWTWKTATHKSNSNQQHRFSVHSLSLLLKLSTILAVNKHGNHSNTSVILGNEFRQVSDSLSHHRFKSMNFMRKGQLLLFRKVIDGYETNAGHQVNWLVNYPIIFVPTFRTVDNMNDYSLDSSSGFGRIHLMDSDLSPRS